MDEREGNKIPPLPPWMRGEWWVGVLTLGIVFGVWAWVKAGGSLTALIH